MSCTTYNVHNTDLDDSGLHIMTNTLQLLPEEPSFGVVCLGYRYKLVVR